MGKSLLKTAVMMIGEFDYSSIFFDDSQAVPFPELTYTLFVVFIILMSIIIMNLLVRSPDGRNGCVVNVFACRLSNPSRRNTMLCLHLNKT